MRNKPNGLVNGQYQDSKNLVARINLHQRFSTNQYGWMRWVFDQIPFPPNGRILELGCGTGELWRTNAERIPRNATLVLADSSEGMLQETKKSLLQLPGRVHFAAVDARMVSFSDQSFDLVIADHMLYHIDTPAEAISEIKRVVRRDGVVYATTNGVDHLKELPELLYEFDTRIECPLSEPAQRFGLENGADQLRKYFADVTIRRYQDSLRVTEPMPLVDYVLSLHGVGNVTERLSGKKGRKLAEFLAGRIARQGSIIVTKDSGMLVACDKK